MSFALLGILQSQTLAAGGAGSYDLLETTELTSSASSVSFTGLGSYTDYKHLQIRGTVRSIRATSTNDILKVNFNNDTATNYVYHRLSGDGSAVASTAQTSASTIETGFTPVALDTANIFAGFVMDILDFSSSSKNTTLRSLMGNPPDARAEIRLGSGLWLNTAAITDVTLGLTVSDFVTGSRFSLYGIK